MQTIIRLLGNRCLKSSCTCIYCTLVIYVDMNSSVFYHSVCTEETSKNLSNISICHTETPHQNWSLSVIKVFGQLLQRQPSIRPPPGRQGRPGRTLPGYAGCATAPRGSFGRSAVCSSGTSRGGPWRTDESRCGPRSHCCSSCCGRTLEEGI